jgi:hypothetical protein
VPFDGDVQVTTSAFACILKFLDVSWFSASLALTVKLYVVSLDVAGTVPVMTPVLAVNVIPDGNDPEVTV